MEIVVSIVGKIGEYLVPPFGEHVGYLISYKRNIMKVEEHYQKLLLKKEAVQQSVEGADWNQEVIPHEVQTWQTNVNIRIEELGKFLEEDVKANTKCLNGWCPNLKFRYSLGKKAQKNTRAIIELLQEGEKYDRVFIHAPPLEAGPTSNGRFKNFESRKTKINHVLEALRDDKMEKIAICGMGGIGKTEMAKEIAKRVKGENLFDKVAIAVVSQNPNLKEIQGEIAEHIVQKINEETLPGRATQLRSMLASKKVLIILDDVWDTLDLDAIGIPHGVEDNSCKILLTSRSEEICNKMKTQKIFPIEILSEKEAWDFFREMAGDCVDTPSLQLKAKMVEEECGRLPIAIAIVGSSMRNNTNENDWDAALEQLKKSYPYNITDLHPKVYASIEFSYSYLKSEEAKSCFLLCCLFPEDYDIPIEDLVRYGVGRRLFPKIDTIAEARGRVHAIVYNLKRSNLLLDSSKEAFIKMHDVVRDVAISIASRDEHGFMVRCDVGLEEWPYEKDTYEGFIAISLMLKRTTKHPERLNCPRLQLLRLSSSYASLPPNMFDGMKELRVLSLENMYLEPLPPSIQVLKNLRVLKLENYYCLNNVSAIGALEKLEMLSFCGSRIKEVPKEIGNLRQLKLLDLSRCHSLERIAAGVLSHLSRLEELYIDKFYNWESTRGNGGGTDNASLAEIIPYSHQMMALAISLPSIKLLPQGLHFKNQKMKFRITITPRLPQRTMEIKDLPLRDVLILDGDDVRDIVEKWTNIDPLLEKSQLLSLMNIKNSKNLLHDLDRKDFPCLKDLWVFNCEDVEYLLDVRPDDTLHHGKVLERPCSSRGALNNLRSLELYKCKSLKHVFSVPIASSLVQLQKLVISYCQNMEQIFSLEDEEHKKAFFEMNLPKLTEMKFEEVPMLIGFCKAMDPVDEHPQSTTETSLYQEIKGSGTKATSVSHKLFSSNTISWIPNLQELVVGCSDTLQVLFNLEGQKVKEDCTLSQLTTLNLYRLSALTDVWKNIPQGFQGFHNLMIISICTCDNLTYLFSTSAAKLLVQLQEVYIYTNKLMENIIQREQEAGQERETDIIVFPKLSSFQLWEAPNFASFNIEACLIKLPSIKNIKLWNCPKLKTFGLENQSRRKPKKMDTKLDSRAQGSPVVRDSPNFLGGCLEFCVPHQSISKRSKGSSSVGQSKHYNHGQIPNDPASTEVTLTNQEQSNTEDPNNQVKIWSLIPSNLVESLQNLQQLDVKACDLLEVIFQLEGLHVEESPVFDNLKNLSLASLPKLLHIWKKGPQEIRGFRNLESLKVDGCNSLKYLFPPSLAKLLMKLKIIRVRNCNEMVALTKQEQSASETDNQVKFWSPIPSNLVQSLQNLEELDVEACDLLEVIFQLEGLHVEESPVFDNLQKLSLAFLPKLLHIWKKGPQEIRGFRNLESLEVYECHSLKYLFPPSIAKLLMKLKIIRVRNCNEMVALTKQEQSASETDNQVKFWSPIPSNLVQSLQNLEELDVKACDLLEVIFQLEGLHVEESPVFDNLQKLSLASLPKLLHIWKKGPQEIRGFRNLESLEVDECHSLKYLFPPSIAKLLMKLKIIRVRNCNKMNEILAKGLEGDEEKRKVIVFPQVNSLVLENLPKLECFCNEANAFEWPSLEGIRIVRCNSLKMFVPTEMKTPNLQGVSTEMKTPNLQPMKGDLNATIQYMSSKEKAGSNDEGSNEIYASSSS